MRASAARALPAPPQEAAGRPAAVPRVAAALSSSRSEQRRRQAQAPVRARMSKSPKHASQSPPWANKRKHTVSHENGHHFIGHQHAVPGEAQATIVPDEPSDVDERLQRVAVLLKDVDAVPAAGRVRVDAGGETQAGEQRLLETLLTCHRAPFALGTYAIRHTTD